MPPVATLIYISLRRCTRIRSIRSKPCPETGEDLLQKHDPDWVGRVRAWMTFSSNRYFWDPVLQAVQKLFDLLLFFIWYIFGEHQGRFEAQFFSRDRLAREVGCAPALSL